MYLEDEDDDEDEDEEGEAEAVPEPELEPEAKPEPEPEAKPSQSSHLCQSPSPRLEARGVWAALNPVNWFKQPEVQKMKNSADKKDRPKQATVVCDVCGKSVSGDGAWQMHIEGAYHKKALLRKEREAAGEVIQPPNPPGTGRSAEETQVFPPGVEGSTNDTSKKNMNTFMELT